MIIKDLLTASKTFFLDILFPLKCVVCEKETEEMRKNKLICTSCLKKIKPSLSFYCPLCKARSDTGELCLACRNQNKNLKSKFYLDKLLSPFSYNNYAVNRVIKAFKYQYIKGLAQPIGRLLAVYLKKIEEKIDFDDFVVVPVPLHKRKFFKRGYNQSELIAKEVFNFLNSNYEDVFIYFDVLLKAKPTKDQASLDKKLRINNLKNVFLCKSPNLVQEKNILLVDDVYTTGTTLNECAKVLKEAGASQVVGLVIAKG